MFRLLENLNTPESLVVSLLVLGSGWVWTRKEGPKILASIFPLFTIIETIFVAWRWNHPELFEKEASFIYGVIPSFLMAIALPFMGFFLHFFFPKSIKKLLRESYSYPFVSGFELRAKQVQQYYIWALSYTLIVLIIHEISQILNISSRNTYDFLDIIFIVLGAGSSLVFFLLLRNRDQLPSS